MMLYLYLEVDLSDDDADLDEVARDCGHTFSHPQLSDWDLLGVTNWHGHACLEFQLQMKASRCRVRSASVDQRYSGANFASGGIVLPHYAGQ